MKSQENISEETKKKISEEEQKLKDYFSGKHLSFLEKLKYKAKRFKDLDDREFNLEIRERQLKIIALDLILKDRHQNLKVIDYLYSTAVK